jgi:hypothetical protein
MRCGMGLCLGAMLNFFGSGGPVGAQELGANVIAAELASPTDRYDHGVFGEALEWGCLVLTVNSCPACANPQIKTLTLTLPQTCVFEDLQARLADLDGDGLNEVVVVETDQAKGASLAVYDATGKRAATAFIGQARRWLAPAGIGDFDGDGRVEIAYVDRPHLARELVFVRYEGGQLREIARAAGFTNHRFGDAAIAGGTRRCDGQDRLILTSGDGTRLVEVTLRNGDLRQTDLGALQSWAEIDQALQCP